MTTSTETVAIVLHFNDFRLADNRVLARALSQHLLVLPLYVYTSAQEKRQQFGVDKISGHRLDWRRGAISDLRHRYQQVGADLVIREGDWAEEVAKIAREIDAVAIYGQRFKTSEEMATCQAIEKATPTLAHHWIWNDTLFEPNELPVNPATFPWSFSSFRRKVEKRFKVPKPISAPLIVPMPQCSPGSLPEPDWSLPELNEHSPIETLAYGETGAWAQVDAYLWTGDHLKNYKETRNGMLNWADSSKLSPYLALGLISPRSVIEEVERYERERTQNDSTYWLKFEVLWREYFHAFGFFAGTDLFKVGGVKKRNVDWARDEAKFDRWCRGLTGVPIVDACMRELSQTGYLSNRGRQIVASYLVRYLAIDWRWGAAFFEYALIDYDPCSNWGNWQYLAGVGTDSRDRTFSMRRQTQHYDGQCLYIRRWVPEAQKKSVAQLMQMTPIGPNEEGTVTIG